jgi:hypothetical protein
MDRITKMRMFFGMLLITALLSTACHKKNKCPAYSDLGPSIGKNGQMKVDKPRSGLYDPKMKKHRKH